ncbi:MAG: PAS domain S-box protein [Desulforhopalus sp.]
MKNTPYRLKISVLAAIIVPCFGRIALHGSGVEHELFRYIVPFCVGATTGYLIGYFFDSRQEVLKKLTKTNNRLQEEMKERAQREAWYTTIFDKNPSIFLLIDPNNGRIIDANPKAREFYGYSTETLKQMNIKEINTLSEEAIAKEMKLAIKEKRQVFYFKHKLATGEIRDVEVLSGAITIDDNNLLLSMVKDITELKMLRGIIPICSNCKQIRDGEGYWSQVEAYIQRHSQAAFTHSLCPACIEKLYPGLIDK